MPTNYMPSYHNENGELSTGENPGMENPNMAFRFRK